MASNTLSEPAAGVAAVNATLVKKHPMFLKTLNGTATAADVIELCKGMDKPQQSMDGQSVNYMLVFSYTNITVDLMIKEL